MEIADQIRLYVDSEKYSDALRLGLLAAVEGRCNLRVMESMLFRTATLRSTCMDMASRKMDSGVAYLCSTQRIRSRVKTCMAE
jgi:hypothetical protein